MLLTIAKRMDRFGGSVIRRGPISLHALDVPQIPIGSETLES